MSSLQGGCRLQDQGQCVTAALQHCRRWGRGRESCRAPPSLSSRPRDNWQFSRHPHHLPHPHHRHHQAADHPPVCGCGDDKTVTSAAAEAVSSSVPLLAEGGATLPVPAQARPLVGGERGVAFSNCDINGAHQYGQYSEKGPTCAFSPDWKCRLAP